MPTIFDKKPAAPASIWFIDWADAVSYSVATWVRDNASSFVKVEEAGGYVPALATVARPGDFAARALRYLALAVPKPLPGRSPVSAVFVYSTTPAFMSWRWTGGSDPASEAGKCACRKAVRAKWALSDRSVKLSEEQLTDVFSDLFDSYFKKPGRIATEPGFEEIGKNLHFIRHSCLDGPDMLAALGEAWPGGKKAPSPRGIPSWAKGAVFDVSGACWSPAERESRPVPGTAVEEILEASVALAASAAGIDPLGLLGKEGGSHGIRK